MDPERGKSFDPREHEQLTQISRHFVRLIQLLDRGEQPPSRELAQATQRARELDSIINRYPSECEQAYQEALASDALSEDQKTTLQTLVEGGGGFIAFAHGQLQPLESSSLFQPGQPIEDFLSMRAFACAGLVAVILASEQIEFAPEAIAICGSA